MCIRSFFFQGPDCRSDIPDQIHNDPGGIALAALCHGILIGLSVFVDPFYSFCDPAVQIVGGNDNVEITLLLDSGGHHYAVSLPCKRVGVQDLVASGAYCKGDQDVGDLQGQDLTDGVGAGPGDHQVCGSKDVL